MNDMHEMSELGARPPPRANLAEQVYARLKSELHDFMWAPGDRFSEAEIGQRTGVSRTPVKIRAAVPGASAWPTLPAGMRWLTGKQVPAAGTSMQRSA
jgi:hypothetical protein